MTKSSSKTAIAFVLINTLVISFILLSHIAYWKSTKVVVENDIILPRLPILNNNKTTVVYHSYQELDQSNRTEIKSEITMTNIIDRNNPPKQGSVKTPYQQSQDRRHTMEQLKTVLGLNDTMELLPFLYESTTSTIPTSSSINLPAWSQIEERYGPTFPRILGLERCEEHRNNVVPDPNDRWVAPAGLFHTGTNLLAMLLAKTCSSGKLHPHGQVPYGKHNPIQAATIDGYRIPKPQYQDIQNFSHVLPIVMVRHPLDWMQSLCQQPFAVSWRQTTSSTSSLSTDPLSSSILPCPSLDMPINVKLYKDFRYPNVMDFWSDWYAGYWNYTDGARLIVRLEDLVFAPKETLRQICTCVGGRFRYDSRILRERHGGTTVRELHPHPKNVEHFLVQAWRRHARVAAELTFASSPDNLRLYRELETSSLMRDLLQDLNYNSLGPSD
jgi:hypothetical protein